MKYYQGFTLKNNEEVLKVQEDTPRNTSTMNNEVQEDIKIKHHKFQIKKTAVATFLVATLLLSGFGLGIKSAGYFAGANKTAVTEQLPPNGVQASVPIANLVGDNSISGLVQRTGGAVVAIETESQVANPWAGSNDLSRRFFGPTIPDQKQTVQGLGSGFIISSDGYVLTNNHVIDGATSIKVQLLGSKEPLSAKVIGTDAELDLAVLKIEASQDLQVIPLGDSDQILTGDWVVAIGNPYGLDHTVTMGVISAKGRPLTIEDHQFKNLLQTDASINPGNSGGPLLNLKGEVIGINTAVNVAGQGLGFAIPINTVQEVLQELINQGKVSRPWLGVSIMDMTQEIADYLQTDKQEGVVIAGIVSKSPAEQAGLKQGDIILSINNQKVTKSEEVTELIVKSKIGAKIELKIIRNKAEQIITATLAEK